MLARPFVSAPGGLKFGYPQYQGPVGTGFYPLLGAVLPKRPRLVRICPSPIRQEITELPRKPNFSRYLRDARLQRGMSVAELAERVGVSAASIYFWESDRVRPRDANLSALCKALRLPVKTAREIAAG
jgi:DNA-binding XRE family transcriptional regulator